MVLVFLTVAVSVIGFIITRLFFATGSIPETQATERAQTTAPAAQMTETRSAATRPATMRLFRPEARATTPELTQQPPRHIPAAATLQTATPRAVHSGSIATAPSAEPVSIRPVMTGTDAPGAESSGSVPPSAPASEPVEPLPVWTPAELRDSLADRAVELDLYSGKISRNQTRKDIQKLESQFDSYNSAAAEKHSGRPRGDVRFRDLSPFRGGGKLSDDLPTRPEERDFIADWIADRPDLSGLPLQINDSCRLHPNQAARLQSASVSYAALRSRVTGDQPEILKKLARSIAVTLIKDTSALVQVLQCEPPVLRKQMVMLLSAKGTDGADAESVQALVDRALFDIDPEVRSLALHQLRLEPAEDVREQLLGGFDYLWEPVTVNAAHALIELEDAGCLDALRNKLTLSDPHAPRQDAEGGWTIRELVRVNHLRNCLLCHAPVVDRSNGRFVDRSARRRFAAFVPEPNEPLPPAGQPYYSSSPGRSRGNTFLRIHPDVTYLKQDFSVMHPVPLAHPWPDVQRFDYFIRERSIDRTEVDHHRKKHSDSRAVRQHAIRFAIDRLSKMRAQDAPLNESLARK